MLLVDVPFTVKLKTPAFVKFDMVRVLLPPGISELGLKLAVAPTGNPLTARLITFEYPRIEVELIVNCALVLTHAP